MENTERPLVQVGSRIPQDHYWYLKRLARKEAVKQDRDISLSDLIRETLLEQYPIPAGEQILGDPADD